jgi:alpha-galactosidase
MNSWPGCARPFPAVEIEACAGGGGRIDAGIARFTHRFWTSDNIDASSRVEIQRGFLQFMPPERMGAHVGASPAHASGRMQSMAFRCGVAMPGHFGVELDVRTIGDKDRDDLAAAIALYKQLRDRLHGGRTWMSDAGEHVVWQAVGSSEAFILIVTRTDMGETAYPPLVRLPMCFPDRRYRIDRKGKAPVEHDGAWLNRVGFALPRMPAEAVRLFEVSAI